MSFKMNAAGTRDQVTSSLEALGSADLGNDTFGLDIRDAIVDAIGFGADLEPPADQRYEVSVSGHSGSNAIVTFNGYIKVVFVPPVAPTENVGRIQDVPLPEPVATSAP